MYNEPTQHLVGFSQPLTNYPQQFQTLESQQYHFASMLNMNNLAASQESNNMNDSEVQFQPP
jgi:hypothetical protein